MDEIDLYLAQAEACLKELASAPGDAPMLAQKQYEYAQLMCAIGKQKEAEPILHAAKDMLQDYREDDIYSGLYYSLSSQYAIVLDYLGMVAECEKVYEELNHLRPSGTHIGDCAFFLHRRKRDYDHAELYYKKSLQLFGHSSIHLKYAGFLRHVRKDLAAAEEHYRASVTSNPRNPDAMGSLASFLHGVHHRNDEAEELYKAAADLDDTHANNLCNFGLFLSEEKQAFTEAERYYKRVLEVNGRHTNTLYNYAVLLDSHLARRDEAKGFYRRVLELDPRHAYALYNLAVLLEEAYFCPDASDEHRAEVLDLYRRAVEADPRDAHTAADFGRFQYLRLGEVAQAEVSLQTALRIDPNCDGALYHLALLTHKERKQIDSAMQMLQRLLSRQPAHANALLLLARVLADRVRLPALSAADRETALEEAVRTYDKAIPLHKDSAAVAAEYLRLVQQLGTSKMKLTAIRTVAELLPKGTVATDTVGAIEGGAAPNSRRMSVADCQALVDQIKASL